MPSGPLSVRTPTPRLLIVDGSPIGTPDTDDIPASPAALGGIGALYFDLLESLSLGLDCHTVPLSGVAALLADQPLASWNGIIWAADSGTASVCQGDQQALRAALEVMRHGFRQRLPQFGSGWGFHLAALAVGGEVIVDPHPDSFPFSRTLTLTQCGVTHPMTAQRPLAFSAPSLHRDLIETLPSEVLILVSDRRHSVQACEILCDGGVFWGVQYQPECDLQEVALFCHRHSTQLVREGWFADAGQAAAYARRCVETQMTPRRDLLLALGLGYDALNDSFRTQEIRHWISSQVLTPP